MKIESTANSAQYIGSGAAVFFGLTANEFAALGGLAIAFIGLLINAWYKHAHYKLVKLKQAARAEDAPNA